MGDSFRLSPIEVRGKNGATNWTMGKLLMFIMIALLLALVIYGFSVKGMGPLVEQVGGAINGILIKLGMMGASDDSLSGCVAPIRLDDALGIGGDFTICHDYCEIKLDQPIYSKVDSYRLGELGSFTFYDEPKEAWVALNIDKFFKEKDLDLDETQRHRSLYSALVKHVRDNSGDLDPRYSFVGETGRPASFSGDWTEEAKAAAIKKSTKSALLPSDNPALPFDNKESNLGGIWFYIDGDYDNEVPVKYFWDGSSWYEFEKVLEGKGDQEMVEMIQKNTEEFFGDDVDWEGVGFFKFARDDFAWKGVSFHEAWVKFSDKKKEFDIAKTQYEKDKQEYFDKFIGDSTGKDFVFEGKSYKLLSKPYNFYINAVDASYSQYGWSGFISNQVTDPKGSYIIYLKDEEGKYRGVSNYPMMPDTPLGSYALSFVSDEGNDFSPTFFDDLSDTQKILELTDEELRKGILSGEIYAFLKEECK
jgi:hypothetical protein